MNAKKLGWDDFFEDQLKTSDLSLIRARVSRQNTDHLMLLSEIGELTGILPGKFKEKKRGLANDRRLGHLRGNLNTWKESKVLIEKSASAQNIPSKDRNRSREKKTINGSEYDRVFIARG